MMKRSRNASIRSWISSFASSVSRNLSSLTPSTGNIFVRNHHSIHIAPTPVFVWLERLNNRVSRFFEVLRGMFVLGRVATSDVAAAQALSQVNPRLSHCQAFLASHR